MNESSDINLACGLKFYSIRLTISNDKNIILLSLQKKLDFPIANINR